MSAGMGMAGVFGGEDSADGCGVGLEADGDGPALVLLVLLMIACGGCGEEEAALLDGDAGCLTFAER